jgi:hypothetical protein
MRPTLVVLEFALLLLAVALVVADRAGRRLAERVAATYLAGPLGPDPVVRVHGTPFLTQAVRGRYADIGVSGGELPIGRIGAVAVQAHVYDVLLPPAALLTGRVGELPCARVTGVVVVPFAELARLSRIPGLSLSYDDGRMIASVSVPVALPGVSQLARATGQAGLSVVGGVVWLRVRGLSVAGISLPSRVLEALVPSLNVPIPLPELPYGLQVDELSPTPSGLAVRASAEDVIFAVPPDIDPDPDVAGRPGRGLAGLAASRLSWPPWASRSAL